MIWEGGDQAVEDGCQCVNAIGVFAMTPPSRAEGGDSQALLKLDDGIVHDVDSAPNVDCDERAHAASPQHGDSEFNSSGVIGGEIASSRGELFDIMNKLSQHRPPVPFGICFCLCSKTMSKFAFTP